MGFKRHILLVVIALFLGCKARGQNRNIIDSLRRSLPSALAEKRFDILNALAFEYRYSYPDSTIHYGTQAYALGQKINVKKNLSKPLSFIGLAKANMGDYKSALDYHNRSIEIAFLQNDTFQLAHSYNNAGRVYLDEGDLARAYNNFIRAKDIFEDLHDKSGLAYVHRSMADLYKAKKDYGQAVENSRLALALRKELGDPRAIASAYMELGLVFEEMDSTPWALQQFASADSIGVLSNDKITRAELRIGIAEILFEEKKLKESANLVKEVLPLIFENTNQKIFLRANLLTARIDLEMKNRDKALATLNKVFESAEKTGNLRFQREAALLLSAIYSERKDSEPAKRYSDLYQILGEKIQNADLNKEIEKLQFQLLIEKAERENEILRVRQVNDESLIAFQRLQNIVLIVVVVLVLVIALLFRSLSLKRRKTNKKLEEQNQHIMLQGEEISKQNEILTRRNRELDEINHEKDTLMNIVAHDLKSPFNRIVGLANILEMEGNLNANQQEYVRLLKDSTRGGLDLIADLLDVHAWQEMSKDPQSVVFDFDKWFLERVSAFYPVAEMKGSVIKVESTVGCKIVSEPDYLGRIMDNLISNAIKFSPRNSEVVISASRSNGDLELTVKDKAPGFSDEDQKFLYQKFKKLSARPTAGESSNGLGLAIVKTLVERLGGSIDLKSSAKGSVFSIRVPVRIYEESNSPNS